MHDVLNYEIWELRIWAAYWGLEPYPDSNLQTAQLCSVYANCHRDPKKKAFTPQDFLPKRRKPNMTGAEISAHLQKFAIKKPQHT